MPGQSINVFEWEKHPGFRNVMNAFLCGADFGINNFDFEKRKLPSDLSFPDNMPSELKETFTNEFSKRAVFHHNSDSGELIPFKANMESRGTFRIFKLVPFFMLVLNKGATFFVDELEASLHPHIAELLIKLFNDPIVNVNNAQLIFTTHDMSLMSQSILRKDQVYLSVKTPEKGTEYMCLDDFDNSLKDSSPFAKWYDEGRLGGIPEINYKNISDAIKEAIEHAKKEEE